MMFKEGQKVRLKGTKSYGCSWEMSSATLKFKPKDIVTITKITQELNTTELVYHILGDFYLEKDLEPLNTNIKITELKKRLQK